MGLADSVTGVRAICDKCGQLNGHWHTCERMQEMRDAETERETRLARILEPYAGPLGSQDLEAILGELRDAGVVPPAPKPNVYYGRDDFTGQYRS